MPSGELRRPTRSPGRRGLWLTAAFSCLLAVTGVGPAAAQTIIDEWSGVRVPPPPALKQASVDPTTTALLLLDFGKQNCGVRPRCLASVPKVAKLTAAARAKGMLVAYSLFGQATPADILTELAPRGGEPMVTAGADKFLGTDLEKTLKDKGITTVIVTGTASHGAVLGTAAGAALRRFKVVVPVDGMSADTAWPDLYTTWHLANAPGGIAPMVTITKLDDIKF